MATMFKKHFEMEMPKIKAFNKCFSKRTNALLLLNCYDSYLISVYTEQ